MQESELRLIVRDRLGLRIEAEMGKYMARKSAKSDEAIAVMGRDARTGEARREMVNRNLAGEQQP